MVFWLLYVISSGAASQVNLVCIQCRLVSSLPESLRRLMLLLTGLLYHITQDNSPPLAHIVGPLAALLGVALVALVCVAAAWRWGLGGFVQRLSEQVEKKAPPGSSAKEVTLVLTDVQVSNQVLLAQAVCQHIRVCSVVYS